MGHVTIFTEYCRNCIEEATKAIFGKTNEEKSLEDINMIERYTRPEMGAIWTEENRFNAWLEVEILAVKLGLNLGVYSKRRCKKTS